MPRISFVLMRGLAAMSAGTAGRESAPVHVQKDDAANMVITVERAVVEVVDGAAQVQEDAAEDMAFTVESLGAAVQTKVVKVADAAVQLAHVLRDDEKMQCGGVSQRMKGQGSSWCCGRCGRFFVPPKKKLEKRESYIVLEVRLRAERIVAVQGVPKCLKHGRHNTQHTAQGSTRVANMLRLLGSSSSAVVRLCPTDPRQSPISPGHG